MPAEPPIVAFPGPAEWEAHLEAHHTDAAGVWLKIAKKATGVPTVTYAEALDVALCWGWIDGQRRGFDEGAYVQRFTPRRARSLWSQRNREHVERLRAAGRMRPPGEAEVERAQGDGRWAAAYDAPSTATVPDDLRAALDATPGAREHWDAFPPSTRRGILEWILAAKRPPTRERRVRETAELAAQGVRANQWRQPGRRPSS